MNSQECKDLDGEVLLGGFGLKDYYFYSDEVQDNLDKKYRISNGKVVTICLPNQVFTEVFVKYIPMEWEYERVKRIFSKYGEVKRMDKLSIRASDVGSKYKNYIGKDNGSIKIKMIIKEQDGIPSNLNIGNVSIEVYYRNQVRTCWKCGNPHKKADCKAKVEDDYRNVFTMDDFPELPGVQEINQDQANETDGENDQALTTAAEEAENNSKDNNEHMEEDTETVDKEKEKMEEDNGRDNTTVAVKDTPVVEEKEAPEAAAKKAPEFVEEDTTTETNKDAPVEAGKISPAMDNKDPEMEEKDDPEVAEKVISAVAVKDASAEANKAALAEMEKVTPAEVEQVASAEAEKEVQGLVNAAPTTKEMVKSIDNTVIVTIIV